MTMKKINYQKELDKIVDRIQETSEVPKLLMHSCCAPCSSYVLEYLSQYFKITVCYYNPNIYPEEEYDKRVEEQKRLIKELSVKNPVEFIEGRFEPAEFYDTVRGLEQVEEGGERCFACFRLRLEETAKLAKKLGADYFTTTLSISPHKNAQKLNEIAGELSQIYDIKNLPSDFKKREGYKRSVELSAEYHLYRQDYCGCVFSQREAELRRSE